MGCVIKELSDLCSVLISRQCFKWSVLPRLTRSWDLDILCLNMILKLFDTTLSQ